MSNKPPPIDFSFMDNSILDDMFGRYQWYRKWRGGYWRQGPDTGFWYWHDESRARFDGFHKYFGIEDYRQ